MELKEMHAFMNDFWQFIKRNFTADPDASDEYWNGIAVEVDAISKKYNEHPAVVKTLVGYLNYLGAEGCGKEGKKI